MLLTFYINYLWVLPKHIGGQLRFSIIHINVVLVVVACALVALARAYEYSIFPPRFPMRGIVPLPHERHFNRLFFMFAFIRDALNFVFVVLAAYSLRMTSHAHRLEHERHEAEVARRDAELKGLRLQSMRLRLSVLIGHNRLSYNYRNCFAICSTTISREWWISLPSASSSARMWI